MDATDQEQIHYTETNAFTAFAVRQDLLLWEATLAMIEVQNNIIQSLESGTDKDKIKSFNKTG